MQPTKIIDGKVIANSIIEKLTVDVEEFKKRFRCEPGLAVIIVGDDPASQVYVRNKQKKAQACGFNSTVHHLNSKISESDLLGLITRLNKDHDTHGILVQLPLPDHISEYKVISTIAQFKDVDGFHPYNVGLLGSGNLDRALIPCTPAGSVILAQNALGHDLSGMKAVVVGRSNIVGKPIAQLLLNEDCTVTIAHSKTQDLPRVTKTADLLIAAVGKPEMIRGDWIKDDAVVIDVGINRVPAPEKGDGQSKLVGDVALDEAIEKVKAITPVPGGVGPMTIARLMINTFYAARRIKENML